MMGPEAMGVANANLVWNDDKVCRNFLCGTCPHALFTNTVCTPQGEVGSLHKLMARRKWIWAPAQSPIRSG
jgi:hypothetical protein